MAARARKPGFRRTTWSSRTAPVYQLVAEDLRAWHAGRSFWRGETDINSCSIGIEIVNPGHDGGYPDFPEAQIDAVIDLCRDCVGRRGICAGTRACAQRRRAVAQGRSRREVSLGPAARVGRRALGASERDALRALSPAGRERAADRGPAIAPRPVRLRGRDQWPVRRTDRLLPCAPSSGISGPRG